MKKQLILPLMVFGLAAFTVSCKKDDVDSSDSTDAALATTNGQSAMAEVSDEATYRMEDPSVSTGGCPTLTWAAEKGTFPNTLTIDFGTSGCEGLNGHVKTGKIIVSMSADRKTEGSLHVITMEDFTVDGNAVTGTKTITNMGVNEFDQPYSTVTVRDASITMSDGVVSTLTADHVRTMTAGYDTGECADDEFSISGTESGVRRGREFSATITVPIVHRFDCRWPVSGVREFTCDDHSGSMDFGTGSCDDEATITRPDGSTKTIRLHR